MSIISVDYETFYDEECSVAPLGNYAYTRHPRFDAYLVTAYDGEESWVGHPKDFNFAALDGHTVVSHNAGFDRSVTDALAEAGKITAPRPTEWHCTANLTAFVCNRRALKDAVKYLYGVTLDKGQRSGMKGKVFADLDPEAKRKFVTYTKDDGVHCRNLWVDYSTRWPDFERRLSQSTIESSIYGCRVDKDTLRLYIRACEKEVIKIEASLPWIKDGGKPTSPKAIAEQCRKSGIPCPPVKSHDAEGFEDWEAKWTDVFDWVSGVGDWRSVTKLLATLKTIESRIRPDGCVETPTKYFGAHTGRWSGESGINFQNFRKDPLICDGVPIDIRRLFCPRAGKKFVLADLSQIEPRVLAWLAGETEMLDLMVKGFSPYEAHARATGMWTRKESLKKMAGDGDEEAKKIYKLSKAVVLGLGYQCGSEKFQTVAKTLADYEVTAEESEAIVTDFRKRSPKKVKLWNRLDTEFKKCIGSSFEMELPSGRVMRYPDIKKSIRREEEVNPETGKKFLRVKVIVSADVGGRRKSMYGGLLTENLTQATSRDVFALGYVNLLDAGARVPFTVHDEAICEVDKDDKVDDIIACMTQTPEWLPGCPIACEAVEADYYKK